MGIDNNEFNLIEEGRYLRSNHNIRRGGFKIPTFQSQVCYMIKIMLKYSKHKLTIIHQNNKIKNHQKTKVNNHMEKNKVNLSHTHRVKVHLYFQLTWSFFNEMVYSRTKQPLIFFQKKTLI